MMKFNLNKKTLMLGGLVIALAATAVTYALLSTNSQQNVNTFNGAYGQVNIAVVENSDETHREDEVNKSNTVEFDKITTDGIKKEVKIKNVDLENYKTTDTYVRVKLVPQIISNEDETVVYGESVKLIYTMNTNADDKDGMWKYDESTDTFYYTRALAPNEESAALLQKVALKEGSIPEGYHLELNVLTDGIIANPIENIKNAWGLTEENGNYFAKLSNVNSTMENK